MASMTRIAMDVNPLRPGLDALSWWLEENRYSQHAREAIIAWTAAEGTPTGCAYLEGDDEAAATEAFIGGLPEEGWWPDESDDSWWLVESGVDDDDPTGEWPAVDPESLPSQARPDRTDDLAPLPPVCGGAPTLADEAWWASYLETEEYVPTAADWADYAAWSESLERRRGWEARTAAWNDARSSGEPWAI